MNPTPPSAGSLTRTAQCLVAADATNGATAALPLVRDVLRRLPEVSAVPGSLQGTNSDRLAALAELCEVIGWILFDAGHYRAAHRMNLRALGLAELAGDRWTARLTLLNHSMLLAHTGHPVAALEAAARTAGPRRLPARVNSLVLVREAHAVALLGGRRKAVELISRAESSFLDGVSRRDPHWAWWFDRTELTGHRGWVLARLGLWDRAVPLLHHAATAPGPSYRRLFSAELLAALAGARAWRDAEQLIADLAPYAARIGSVRTTGTLARTALRLRGCAAAPASLRDAAVFLLESLPARERVGPRPVPGGAAPGRHTRSTIPTFPSERAQWAPQNQ
ncbi:DNA-binding protein [Streptomyces sp. NPDC008001]|uniref:DNA-binding protein n=1 Tax=Streptomyces sp. NPDC008001 TaxID=3364804 RepID=UPI0036E5B314